MAAWMAAAALSVSGLRSQVLSNQGALDIDPQTELAAVKAELAAVKAALKAAQSKATPQGRVGVPRRWSELRQTWNPFREEVRLTSQANTSNDETASIEDDPVRKALDNALDTFHVFPALVGAFKLDLFETLHRSNATFSSLQRGLNVSSKGLDGLLTVFLPMDIIRSGQRDPNPTPWPSHNLEPLLWFRVCLHRRVSSSYAASAEWV